LITEFRKCGKNVKIYPTAKIVNPENLEIGNDVTIGDFCFINAGRRTVIGDRSQLNVGAIIAGGGETIIGKDVTISYHAIILSGTDTPKGEFMNDARPIERRAISRGRIILEDGCFIGANAIICRSKKDITIGRKAVIGAGAYIDEDVEPETIVIPWKHTYTKKRSYNYRNG